MADPTDAPFLIGGDPLVARIDPQGAELSSLVDGAGRELLWSGDPAWWAGRAPILFPIIGELNGGAFRWQGREYTLPRHGFARRRRFEPVSRAADRLVLLLRSDGETRAVYPFDFELEIAFTAHDARLGVLATARNTGQGPMPASLGFHPALRWPLPGGGAREDHAVVFDRDEPAPVRRLDDRGLLRPASLPTPLEGRRLALRDALFVDDVLILDRLRSRSLVYGAEHGPRLRVGFPDATHLGLWTKPGAGFLCIEPWHGVADPEGFRGALDAKPGVAVLPPGGELRLSMTIEVLAGA